MTLSGKLTVGAIGLFGPRVLRLRGKVTVAVARAAHGVVRVDGAALSGRLANRPVSTHG